MSRTCRRRRLAARTSCRRRSFQGLQALRARRIVSAWASRRSTWVRVRMAHLLWFECGGFHTTRARMRGGTPLGALDICIAPPPREAWGAFAHQMSNLPLIAGRAQAPVTAY